MFLRYNQENLCENGGFDTKWCESVANGILKNGLRTTMVSLALDTNDFLDLNKKRTV